MNYKNILTTPLVLGFGMFVFAIPFAYLIKLIDLHVPGLNLALAGYSAALLFTHYLYPHRMSARFKIYAMLITVGIAFARVALVAIANPEARELLMYVLSNLTEIKATKMALLVTLGTSIQLAIPAIGWYFFISMGNKQAITYKK